MRDKKFGVFDFDGTIVDTMPAYFSANAEVIEREYGLSGEEFETYSRLYAWMPTEEIFRGFMELHNKPTDKARENLQDSFDMVNARDFPVIEGAREAIEKVYNKGFELFISSGSGTEKVKERLEKSGLLKYFSVVYGSSEIDKGPAHIEDFAKFAKVSLGDFAVNSFLLGDGPGDMKLAKICKMKAVGVAHTFTSEYLIEAGADVVFEKIREVEDADLI